ncbi:MFS transporter [Streptomyces sp. SLBN-8D4]|jgi:EmrB/QacA subfamily drug resistance transporter|uniref:MFS transporter n=1 Tax=Streptomyces sp. SLBN-8D4 TaxID=3377728 RepID=UPI003C79FDAF
MGRLRVLSIVTAVVLSTFLTALDNTVVNLAIPQMRTELGLTDTDVKWVATAYPLALASFLLLAGRLTDGKGRRWSLLTGVAVFTVSSACCALSTTGVVLACLRGVQGGGAAFILPASLAMMSHDLPSRVRTAGFGATTAAMASALAFGPVISGVVTQHLGWEWLFVMNVPLGVASFVVGALALPSGPSRPQQGPHDGAEGLHRHIALACLSIASFVYCLIQAPSTGLGEPSVIVSGIAAVSGAIVLGCKKRSRRSSSPAVGQLLRARPFAGGLITQLLWGLGVTGVYFYTSQFLQSALHLSPTEAGLTFTPVVSALFLTAPFVSVMAKRWGDGQVAATGLMSVAAGLLLIALGSLQGKLLGLMPGLAAVGAGSALALPLTTRALESSPVHLSGFAAGLFSATRELSGVLGIVLVGAVVTVGDYASVARGATQGQAFLTGYQLGLCVAAALVATGAPVAVWALRPIKCTP